MCGSESACQALRRKAACCQGTGGAEIPALPSVRHESFDLNKNRGVAIGIGIERSALGFGHEKLDPNPAVIENIGRAFRLCEGIKNYRNAKGFDSDTDSEADSAGKPLIYTRLR